MHVTLYIFLLSVLWNTTELFTLMSIQDSVFILYIRYTLSLLGDKSQLFTITKVTFPFLCLLTVTIHCSSYIPGSDFHFS